MRASFHNIRDPRLSDCPRTHGALRHPLSRGGRVTNRHGGRGPLPRPRDQMLKGLRKSVVEPLGQSDPSPWLPVAHPISPRPSIASVVPRAAMLFIVVAAEMTVPGTTVGATTTFGRGLPNVPSSHMMKTAVLPLW